MEGHGSDARWKTLSAIAWTALLASARSCKLLKTKRNQYSKFTSNWRLFAENRLDNVCMAVMQRNYGVASIPKDHKTRSRLKDCLRQKRLLTLNSTVWYIQHDVTFLKNAHNLRFSSNRSIVAHRHTWFKKFDVTVSFAHRTVSIFHFFEWSTLHPLGKINTCCLRKVRIENDWAVAHFNSHMRCDMSRKTAWKTGSSWFWQVDVASLENTAHAPGDANAPGESNATLLRLRFPRVRCRKSVGMFI